MPKPLLKDRDREEIGRLFGEHVTRPVTLVLFTVAGSEEGALVEQLLGELASTSDRVTLEVRDLAKDGEEAARLGIDKTPGFAILAGGADTGIRFFGVPAGGEFAILVEDILDAGGRGHGLPDALVAELARVDKPVHLQVLITPT